MNEFSYKLAYPGIVEIRDGIETLRLNMEGLEAVVENVKLMIHTIQRKLISVNYQSMKGLYCFYK